MKHNSGKANRAVVFVLVIMVVFNLFLLAWIGWPMYQSGWKNFSIPFLVKAPAAPAKVDPVIGTQAQSLPTTVSSATLMPTSLPTIRQ